MACDQELVFETCTKKEQDEELLREIKEAGAISAALKKSRSTLSLSASGKFCHFYSPIVRRGIPQFRWCDLSRVSGGYSRIGG